MSSLQKELESAYHRASAAESAAADARASANRSATLALEMERLTEENAVLGQRFDQMAGDLKCVMPAPGPLAMLFDLPAAPESLQLHE